MSLETEARARVHEFFQSSVSIGDCRARNRARQALTELVLGFIKRARGEQGCCFAGVARACPIHEGGKGES